MANQEQVDPQTDGRPLLLDEMAARPDAPATERISKEMAALLGEQRLHLSGVVGEPINAELLRKADDGTWEMRLPKGASLGRVGLRGERMERPKGQSSSDAHTKPMRPAWMSQSYQPRHANARTVHPPMKRRNGRS